MSSRNYTVTVHVKDDGTVKKLESLGGLSPGGGRRGSSIASSAGFLAGGSVIFGGLEKIAGSQLLKLAGIGLGIGTIVHLLTKSSGHLQGLFKLFETSLLLFFKPIGDFIGLALRPLALALLKLAIPFYKIAAPFFRNYGKAVGEALANAKTWLDPTGLIEKLAGVFNPGDISAGFSLATTTLQTTWDTFVKDVSATLTDAPSGIQTAFIMFGTELYNKIVNFPGVIWSILVTWGQELYNRMINLPGVIWSILVTWGQELWNKIISIPSIIFQIFVDFGQTIWNFLSGVPDMILGAFTTLVTNLGSALANVPSLIWNTIKAALSSVLGGAGGGGETFGIADKGRSRTTVASIAETVNL